MKPSLREPVSRDLKNTKKQAYGTGRKSIPGRGNGWYEGPETRINLVWPSNSRKVSVPGVPRKVIGDDSTEFNRGQIA